MKLVVWEEDNKILIERDDVSSDSILALTKDEAKELVMKLHEFIDCSCC